MTPLVSVLVPTYRAGPFLGMLVESVKAQTHSQWELLIMDDGSGDLDHPAVRPTLADPRIQTFRWYPNRGVSQATRFLMGQAKGEFWCYPGADDLLAPEFLVKRLAVMEEHPEVALVFGKGAQINANGEEIWFHEGRMIFIQMENFDDKLVEAEQMLKLLVHANVVNTPSILARARETLPILTRYSVNWRYCQDWFYWVLLAGNGLNFFYSGEILHSYRFHENSLSQSAQSWAWRNVEPALVLLTGLAFGAQTGELAVQYSQQLRTKLTANWLLRSARFRKHPSWPHWRSLAQSLSIRWFEWPSVVLQMMRILRIRRKYRANGLLLHGLPE